MELEIPQKNEYDFYISLGILSILIDNRPPVHIWSVPIYFVDIKARADPSNMQNISKTKDMI
jgi:hypothetical protein